MKIGSKIQKIREIKGYSQEVVADELGISQAAYSKLEQNQTSLSLDKIYALAEVFGISVEQLLSFDENNILNNHHQQGGNAANVIVQSFSEKERDLYESKIKHLEEEVLFLRSLLQKNE